MNENSVVNGAEPKNSPPEALIPPVPDDFDPSIFPRELKEHNGVIFIMLRNIVPKTTGLEMSAFRRAKLFREKFGIDVYLITNHYQTDLLEQCAAYGLDFPVLNFYDYYQEFDRKVKPSPEEIGDPKGEQDARFKHQDTYSKFGFLSRRRLIDPDTNRAMEALFYRADGSIAVREVYDYPNDKLNVKTVELIDRDGAVRYTFNTRNDAIAHWVLELVSDKSKRFFIIGDRILEYYNAYIKMTELGIDNVCMLHQLHNIHVLKPLDPFTSKPGFKYFYDKRVKADIILVLTKRQGADIVKRFKFNNTVVLPHSLVAVQRVKDVERDPFKIVQVGRVVEEKGHAKSVEVMRRVLDYVPQAHLHFYGRGPQQEAVQKLIDEAGLGDRIKFEGFVDNMPAVFASAALSILPSTFEESPLVVQESMQQGCPVVAFNCNYGPDDVIEDGMMQFHLGMKRDSREDTHSHISRYLDLVTCAMIYHPVEGLPKGFPLLMVEDTIKACMELALAARKRFQGKMIAITGSAGKTTTTYMLRHVLGQDHDVVASYGSVNLGLGVPLQFANVKQDTTFAIIEMAIGAFTIPRGSITYDLPPHIAVVTSITNAHIEAFGSPEGLARRKARIFNGMSAGGYAILNRDMPHYDIFEQKALSKNLNIITFGKHPDSTIRMAEIKNGGSFSFGGRSYTLECSVPSEQLYDALAVVGVAIASGVSIEYALRHLKTFTPVKGRGSVIETEYNGRKLRVIDSAYNANVASMSSALKYLTELESEASRRVAILGDIAELGANEIAHHRSLAEAVLSTQADRVLLVGSLMKHLYDDIKDKINGAWFPTYKELIAGVDAWLRDGDTVLLKSSNATGLTHAVEHLTNATAPSPEIIHDLRLALNVPKARFDVREFLPEGITPELNGRMPKDLLIPIADKIFMYVDAARSWNAMLKAAKRDGVLIKVNHPFNTYRTFESQEREFKHRFTPIESRADIREGAIRVEYEGRVWQLNNGQTFAQVPGFSSHCYGLAVDIQNEGVKATRDWLNANAESFGFKREFDFEPWHFTYVRGREGLSARVLEIEKE